MSVRKGYIYALILALGLLLWSNVWEMRQQPEPLKDLPVIEMDDQLVPWKSAEAVYECAMKAEELSITIRSMHLASEVMQGSIELSGPREKLQSFYDWLETDGRFRAILAFQMETSDENNSQLSISYQL